MAMSIEITTWFREVDADGEYVSLKAETSVSSEGGDRVAKAFELHAEKLGAIERRLTTNIK